MRALILGITGQDGSYLAEWLLGKGYQVAGVYRRTSTGNFKNIQHFVDKLKLYRGDLSDPLSLDAALRDFQPSEVYNLADQDDITWSHSLVDYNCDVTASAVARLLELVRRYDKSVRVFQPISATIFGDAPAPQNESTPLNPLSPYACAKAAAYHFCRFYRQVHGMFVSTAILYNHDSPRRTEHYLLQKITRTVFEISKHTEKEQVLTLGSLDMMVDIGYAKEFVTVMHRILLHSNPDDFVVGTGKPLTIRGLANEAFEYLGLQPVYAEDPKILYKGPPHHLVADIGKLRSIIGHYPVIDGARVVHILLDALERGAA